MTLTLILSWHNTFKLNRWLYWSDWGRPAKIERASMDGNREQTIVNTGLVWPNALTIDREAQVLYWADAHLDKIESSNVDGTNRRIILQDGIHHPFSIAFFNSTLYWSDWEMDTIYSSKLIGSRSLGLSSLGQRLSTEPMAVQVISTQIQVNCKNFICAYCLLMVFDHKFIVCSLPPSLSLSLPPLSPSFSYYASIEVFIFTLSFQWLIPVRWTMVTAATFVYWVWIGRKASPVLVLMATECSQATLSNVLVSLL
jgi:hypothetical protein